MPNDSRCVGKNLIQTRRDAKIKALELLSEFAMDGIERNMNTINGIESDRDLELVTEELNNICFSLKERARKLKRLEKMPSGYHYQ